MHVQLKRDKKAREAEVIKIFFIYSTRKQSTSENKLLQSDDENFNFNKASTCLARGVLSWRFYQRVIAFAQKLLNLVKSWVN